MSFGGRYPKSPPEGDGTLSRRTKRTGARGKRGPGSQNFGVGPGLTASSASELGGSSLHLLVVRCRAILILLTLFKSHSIRHNKRANALHPRPPFLHWLTASLQAPPESQCQGVRHTGPSPEGNPTAMQSGRLPSDRGPVPHGGEWGSGRTRGVGTVQRRRRTLRKDVGFLGVRALLTEQVGS